MLKIKEIKKFFGLKKAFPLGEVYRYSTPVWNKRFFYVRDELCREVTQCLGDAGVQLLLYGPSGVGKSSISLFCLAQLGLNCLRICCSSEMNTEDFLRILLGYLEEHRLILLEVESGSDFSVSGGLRFPLAQLSAKDKNKYSERKQLQPWIDKPSLTAVVDRLFEAHIVLLVDDIEKVDDNGFCTCLRDLAKALSDSWVDARSPKVIMTAAETNRTRLSDALLPNRNRIEVIEVPLMNKSEVAGLIRHGIMLSWLRLVPAVIDEIIDWSYGIPAKVQRICLETGRAKTLETGITDDRLTGDETAVDIEFFRSKVLPRLKKKGIIG